MNLDSFEQALINSTPYISDISKFKNLVEKLNLKEVDLDKKIEKLKKYQTDDRQLITDINIFLSNLEKLK